MAGWGLKRDEVDKVYKPTTNLKIMSLQVNPKSLCDYIFTKEQLEANREKKLTKLDEKKLAARFKYGFSSGINCVGNDFVISQGNNQNIVSNVHSKQYLIYWSIII